MSVDFIELAMEKGKKEGLEEGEEKGEKKGLEKGKQEDWKRGGGNHCRKFSNSLSGLAVFCQSSHPESR